MRELRLTKVFPAVLLEILENDENSALSELVDEHGLSVVVAGIIEFYKQLLREEIREGVSNFDSPDTYESQTTEVDPLARVIGQLGLMIMIGTIARIDEPELGSYVNNLTRAALALDDDDPLVPIFVFLSVQDGLMHWLCEHENVKPDRTSDGTTIYFSSTKRETLGRIYRETRDETSGESTLISPDLFMHNLRSFYEHRNAIMHGDPGAHFDKKIATISLLFLDLTLYTVIERIDGFDQVFGIPEDEDWEEIVSRLSAELKWEELLETFDTR